jgi:Tfp pilus assembly protein PilO
MKNGKLWAIAFIVLLVINIGSLVYLNYKDTSTNIESLKEENKNLKQEYIGNAKQLKYVLETLLDNSEELKSYMPEYRNKSNKEFEKALRKKLSS